MTGHADLDRACTEVADSGTDPGVLARVLAAVLEPRRSGDALRRAVRDHGRDPADLATVAGAPGRAAAAAARRVVQRWAELDVQVALVGDPGYPSRLADGWPSTDGPVLLARRGRTVPDGPAVALVGARRASGYGTAVAAWLADAAATAGVTVVSGGAVGIDAAAHGAVLDRDAPTVVVLGCGHAVGYPRAHTAPGGLFDRVLAAGGCLLSELLPDEPPRPGQVRARNRIVAALADVVVVVEGGARSGALVTAGAAADRGRTVLAVPGDVRAAGSAAPHRLLAEGAAPCASPSDLLDALHSGAAARGGIDPTCAGDGGGDAAAGGRGRGAQSALALDGDAGGSGAVRGHRPSALPPELAAVLAAAWPRPLPVEQLASGSGRDVPAVLAALTRARIAGEIAEGPDGIRFRRAPPTA